MAALAQGPGGPQLRFHTATQTEPLDLVAATLTPPLENQVEIRPGSPFRELTANGIPKHDVGAFSNRANPHTIVPQAYRIPLAADPVGQETPVSFRGPVGFAVNGVSFDPGAAEFWHGDPSLGWTYLQDYEFAPDSGDLDACNGRFGVTPEFPEGTYAYFLTRDWPVIPRMLRGQAESIRPGFPPPGGARPPRSN